MSTNTATHATAETDSPRVWVGCLGCYNDGNLFGKWVEGHVAADFVAAGLATLETVCDYTTERCVRCFCDEFHVFDHENFGPFLEGECDPWEAQEAAEAVISFNEAIKNSSVPKLALFAFADNHHLKVANFAAWIEDAEVQLTRQANRLRSSCLVLETSILPYLNSR